MRRKRNIVNFMSFGLFCQKHVFCRRPYIVGENIIATIKMRNNFCYSL